MKCGENIIGLFDHGTLTIQGTGPMYDYVCFSEQPWWKDVYVVKLQDGVTSIGAEAFSGCANLARVTIPGSVTHIGDGAFRNCGSLTRVTIPDGVTRIGEYAFSGCRHLSEVTVPDSVTSIGEYAFFCCSNLKTDIPDLGSGATWSYADGTLTVEGTGTFHDTSYFHLRDDIRTVNIKDGVTGIGSRAFSGCKSLTSVTIPGSVTHIGNSAFSWCESLTRVTIPDSVTSIGAEAFYRCKSLTEVTIPGSVAGIGAQAFWGCDSLTGVTMLNGVASIGGCAFSYCENLVSVTIPDSVTSIGAGAFGGSSLTRVTVSGGAAGAENENRRRRKAELWQADRLKHYYNIKEYHESDMWCGAGVTWSFSDGVLTVQGTGDMEDFRKRFDDAHYNDRPWSKIIDQIHTVIIRDGVTSVGAGAFEGCEKLTGVTIPDSVTCIGEFAFDGCIGLSGVTIPGSVARIGKGAFSGCVGLTGVTVTGSGSGTEEERSLNAELWRADRLTTGALYPERGISSCGENVTWSYRDGTLTIQGTGPMDDYESYGKRPWEGEDIRTVMILDGVTRIGMRAFKGCKNLTGATIPDSVTSIGAAAFSGCVSLTGVSIPGSVTVIGRGAFYGCGMTSVSIPGSVAVIGAGAFYGCVSLTHVTISDGFTTVIGVEAFADCKNLTSVTIPGNVTRITGSSFSGCGPKEVRFGGSKSQWDSLAFWQFPFLNSFIYCSDHTYVPGVFANDIKWSYSSGVLTFQGTGSLECKGSEYHWNLLKNMGVHTVHIGDGVTAVGDNAFWHFSKLVRVTLPDSITAIGALAFADCESLVYINIPSGVTSIGQEAFSQCRGLLGMDLPASVTAIGQAVFGGLTVGLAGLIDIYYSGSEEQWKQITIGECKRLIHTTIHYNSIPRPQTECISGRCGDNVTWTYTDDGYLTVRGTGDMANFGGTQPWYNFREKIRYVVISEGVTRIGSHAFSDCVNLIGALIPFSVKELGREVFSNCGKLKCIHHRGTEWWWKDVLRGPESSPTLTVTHTSYGPPPLKDDKKLISEEV